MPPPFHYNVAIEWERERHTHTTLTDQRAGFCFRSGSNKRERILSPDPDDETGVPVASYSFGIRAGGQTGSSTRAWAASSSSIKSVAVVVVVVVVVVGGGGAGAFGGTGSTFPSSAVASLLLSEPVSVMSWKGRVRDSSIVYGSAEELT
jgi:hypothetical protein